MAASPLFDRARSRAGGTGLDERTRRSARDQARRALSASPEPRGRRSVPGVWRSSELSCSSQGTRPSPGTIHPGAPSCAKRGALKMPNAATSRRREKPHRTIRRARQTRRHGWRAVNPARSVSLHRAFFRHKRREVRPGMVRSSVPTAPGWGSNGERVAGRELRSRRDARGEVQGVDSACETSPRDARSDATCIRSDAGRRTPTADPVETVGAATGAEHASESERGDGVDTNEIPRVARRELRSRRDARGEVQGVDSACETNPRDARSNATWFRPDARYRTPTADPVEAAGAPTETEHASASERGAGGDPECNPSEASVATESPQTQHSARASVPPPAARWRVRYQISDRRVGEYESESGVNRRSFARAASSV